MSLEETASRCCAPRLQSSEVHGTKENLLEHLRRELNILQIHNKWNQIVLTHPFSVNCFVRDYFFSVDFILLFTLFYLSSLLWTLFYL